VIDNYRHETLRMDRQTRPRWQHIRQLEVGHGTIYLGYNKKPGQINVYLS